MATSNISISLDALDLADQRFAQGFAVLHMIETKMLEMLEDENDTRVRECAESLWGATALLKQAQAALKAGRAG